MRDKLSEGPTLIPTPVHPDADADSDDIDYRGRWAATLATEQAFRLALGLAVVVALLCGQAVFWDEWRCAFVRCSLSPDTDGDGR